MVTPKSKAVGLMLFFAHIGHNSKKKRKQGQSVG